MLNDHLRHDVEEELRYEPRVDDRAIAVAAADGEVTLRGTVGSFRERREAVHATKRVLGVNKVHDGLHVRLLDTDRRSDADLRGAVLQALMLDSLVPSTIDARAKDGTVTLTGLGALQLPARRGDVRGRERSWGDRHRRPRRADHRGSDASRRQALHQQGLHA